MNDKTILLNPGPVTLSSRVRGAMLRADLCHREPEFAALQTQIREKLLNVYALPTERWAVALLTGSGTAAVEAMISTLVPENGQLLVIENGVYGERISKIAERYRISCVTVSHDWHAPIDTARVSAALSMNPGVTHVAVIHHETTTGRLNDLEPLGELCRAHGAQLLLDAVSSFGAEHIDFTAWPIAGCAATANKCLHGVPGTCFVVVAREALGSACPRNVYLDVGAYVQAQDQAGTPFTQSVQTFYALNEALDELADSGGVAARFALYAARLARIRGHLRGLGVTPLLDDDECSQVLHAFELPHGITYTALHDALKSAGFIIYAGQGDYAKTLFRISMMGEIGEEDVVRLEKALTDALT